MDDGINILLIEDDAEFGRLVRSVLARSGNAFLVEQVYQLSEALIRLARGGVDAVLLDLRLPDSRGLSALAKVQKAAPRIPVVVLTAVDDAQMARRAVQAGAQDYLVKGQADLRGLGRSISFALERQRAQEERDRHLSQLAILRDVDEDLTRRLDVDFVLMMALDTAVRLSLASAGLIGLIDNDALIMLKNINYEAAKELDTPMLGRGVVGRCLRERKAQRVLDVTTDPDYVAILPRTRAQIAIPLISQDRTVGFLSLETTDPVRFTEETFDFLKLLAGRIATAVDNARLYETAQVQLSELQVLYNQVRDLEQVKTDMIRIASHDLRGPLNNATQSVYLLRRLSSDSLSPQAESFMGRIDEAIERMRAITDGILSLERLDATSELHTEPVDLCRLTERAFQENQGQARLRQQCFALHLPARPLIVRGEPALLYEAMTNLIGNAIKYTPEGGTITVLLHQNVHTATFKVEDTGYGIPEDQQERLFQPFYRVRTAEVEGIDGTGLGLHLVQNIITRYDGQILFKSVYGEGSTFGFRLPLI